MQLELDDQIIAITGLSENEVKECLAVALYKLVKLNGVAAGRLLNKNEIEFHGLLGKYGCYVNYDVQDLLEDMETLKRLDEQDQSKKD